MSLRRRARPIRAATAISGHVFGILMPAGRIKGVSYPHVRLTMGNDLSVLNAALAHP